MVPVIAKVEVDQETCIGCGTCWVTCPDTFKEVEVGLEYKAASTDQLSPEQDLRTTAEGCPSLSITLLDSDGGVVFPTEADRSELSSRQQW